MEIAQEVEVKLRLLAIEQSRLTRKLELAERDLTARTAALAASEARFRDVIEQNADAIIVIDRAGVVRFANVMATRLFGGRRSALIGGTFGFPLVAGETTELDVLSDEGPRVAEMRVVPSEWEGESAWIASLRDITDRKQAEQNARALIREQAARNAAEDSARRLRFLLESSTLLTASLDETTILAELARLCVRDLADWTLVYSRDEAERLHRIEVACHDPLNRPVAERLKETPFDPGHEHPLMAIMETRRPLLAPVVDDALTRSLSFDSGHLALLRELGLRSLMVLPMAAHDRALGVIALISSQPDRQFGEHDVALAEDIAARAALAIENARLYDAVKKANETKTDFLAVLSHDLRTPLTAILGYADLLDIGVPEPLPNAARERVRRIRTSAHHLLYLLNELLAFARLDAGHEEVRLTAIDALEVAREVAAVMEPLAHARGLHLRLVQPLEPTPLTTDADKLRQILLNLVGNAIKYTEHGDITISVQAHDRGVEIQVGDTGTGIAPEHLKRIFEPFWQADPSQRSKGSGTGLGLSVVRRLARLLGGDVTVQSALGCGSTFRLMLPAR